MEAPSLACAWCLRVRVCCPLLVLLLWCHEPQCVSQEGNCWCWVWNFTKPVIVTTCRWFIQFFDSFIHSSLCLASETFSVGVVCIWVCEDFPSEHPHQEVFFPFLFHLYLFVVESVHCAALCWSFICFAVLLPRKVETCKMNFYFQFNSCALFCI